MSRMVDKECGSTVYITPEKILGPVRDYFGGIIDLDPATEPNNPTKARAFFTEADDGLARAWYVGVNARANVFLNPPYGKALRAWVGKLHEEAKRGVHIVALLPGQRFETDYWQRHVLSSYLTAICFVRSRVPFLRPDGTRALGNPYGSILYVYNGDAARAREAFGGLGLVARLEVLARRAEVV